MRIKKVPDIKQAFILTVAIISHIQKWILQQEKDPKPTIPVFKYYVDYREEHGSAGEDGLVPNLNIMKGV